jgi:hypothetical protein
VFLKTHPGKRDLWSAVSRDCSFDIKFWQDQGDEAIFAAAWELVELAEEVRHGRAHTQESCYNT